MAALIILRQPLFFYNELQENFNYTPFHYHHLNICTLPELFKAG